MPALLLHTSPCSCPCACARRSTRKPVWLTEFSCPFGGKRQAKNFLKWVRRYNVHEQGRRHNACAEQALAPRPAQPLPGPACSRAACFLQVGGGGQFAASRWELWLCRAVMTWADNTPWVQRYAWFSLTTEGSWIGG